MKKFLKLNALILLSSISLTVITPSTLVHASDVQTEVNDGQRLAQMKEDLRTLAVAFSHNKAINGEISENLRLTDDHALKYTHPSSLTKESSKSVAANMNDMVFGEIEGFSAHKATLRNRTNRDQNLSSAEYSFTDTDTVRTQTTEAVGNSKTTNATMTFPFASGSMSMNVNYNFGKTDEVTTTSSKTWIIPSQTVLVPAGCTYQLVWVLNVGTVSGTSGYGYKVTAQVPFKMHDWRDISETMPIGEAISQQEKLVNSLGDSAHLWGFRSQYIAIDDNTALKLYQIGKTKAKAGYKARIGTELKMDIVDITDGKNVLVDSIPMDIVPQAV
ncbi:ETX/MTX2 family pore-forming toxin [Candidatus Enterococcus ikei]|uniref:ETX/MTX2 family pore-forming toxin n=1 Tax=Candidatus Enterococcus ikei TaxID=2815326 RepID=A0ABS3H2U4_9ENTE|nr:ETX/MTX2 family pore-forming toxin [Enterococcus sp. DIV0869a]MBO0440994.1 ETX/MTX2 family pore-forming toxin [Enterococcus sp. DIV0869a]